jgi:hypothetical protein
LKECRPWPADGRGLGDAIVKEARGGASRKQAWLAIAVKDTLLQ